MSRIKKIKQQVSTILLISIFYLLLFPVSLLKKFSGSQTLYRMTNRTGAEGWYRSDWNTADKEHYTIVLTGKMDDDPFISNRRFFNQLRSEDRGWLMILYRMLARLTPITEAQDEKTLPTDRYVMF